MIARNFLNDIPWRWMLVWLILPCLPIVLCWPIGGPPMRPEIVLMGAVALIGSQLPWLLVRRLLLIGMTLMVTAMYVSKTFNLNIVDYTMLWPFLSEVKPWRSPEYLIGGVVIAGALVAEWRLAPTVERIRGVRQWALALLAPLAIANTDKAATDATASTYMGLPDPAKPFASATRLAGVEQPKAAKRNLVVVLVEALGDPIEPGDRAVFDRDWNRPEWRARYDVVRGTTPYYGSTTSGEMRELCSRWADVTKVDFATMDCLPARYDRAGYETTAWHSFSGWFFERTAWWPKLGFEHTKFAEDMKQMGARPCGGVFPGACDPDVPALIADQLKRGGKPQMHYWVTLNSHLPVLDDPSLGTTNCSYGGAALADGPPMLCRIYVIHHQLADALTKMALDPALPPTDILIVGDHMPPFFQRGARVRYAGDRVPWIMLRAKN